MDPIINAVPDAEGYVGVCPGVQLHYELYHPPSTGESNGKVLVVMGAFATKVHFAGTARYLADSGYEVCMYDHRGVGKSGRPVMEQQTSRMLAEDAVVVLDTIWGSTAPVHIYGASMGGMVAQELALMLLPQQRLLSLGLAVTCRGLKPLGGLLSPIFTPKILKPVLQAWYWDSRPALVRRLMRLVLSRNLLGMVHPSGEKYETVYFREWLQNFESYWTFKDHTAGACHACVVLHHYLSERSIAMLRDSGVPILCQVSTHDHLIPPAMQFELARMLRAKTVTFPTGHMGMLPWKERYHNMLLEHFAVGAAVRAVQESEAARGWRMSRTVLAEQQQLLHGQPSAPGKSLLSGQLSTDSALSCSSSSSSSCDRQYIGTAASLDTTASIGSTSSSCTASGELPSCSSDADLSVDVSEWSSEQLGQKSDVSNVTNYKSGDRNAQQQKQKDRLRAALLQ